MRAFATAVVRFAVLCAVTVTAATAASAAPPRDSSPSPPEWAPCASGPAECASLAVPVDWAVSGGPRTRLDLRRTRAGGARIGVLVLPPPQSPAQLTAALRARFDVVTYSARAPGLADPSAPCLPPTDVTYSPTTADQFQHLAEANSVAFRQCRQRYGDAWLHLDSATEAHDVDAVRRALGEPRISLLSSQPDALVGQLYAEVFGAHLRALVLDGSPDHSLADPGTLLTSAASGVEATFSAFASWCDRSTDCAFHGRDVRGFYQSLRPRVERGEFRDLRGYPFDFPTFAKGALEGRLASPRIGWFDLAEHLLDIDKRDHFGTLPPALESAATTSPLLATVPGAPVSASGSYDFATVRACQDWTPSVPTYAELQTIKDSTSRVAPIVRVSGQQWTAAMFCAGWPFPVPDPPHRPRPGRAVPVLVAYGTENPRQPVSWPQAVLRQIPGSRELVYAGGGTAVYPAGGCGADAIDRFLITRSAPPSTRCPAVGP